MIGSARRRRVQGPPRRFHAHGAAAELLACFDSEILYEGPAGTGKTTTVLEKCDLIWTTWPQSRILFVRDTRKSLNDSVLEEWETRVLGPGHPALRPRLKRRTRDDYEHPNGSRVVLAGMDNPDRIMSTQFDVIAVFEGTEVAEDAYLKLLTRNRNGVTPFQQMIVDVNPAHEFHHFNVRADQPYVVPEELREYVPPPRPGQTQMTRLYSRHTDNPAFWTHATKRWTKRGAEYMAKLHALTGVQRERLLLGKWVSASGLVWPEYDPQVHLVYPHELMLDPANPRVGTRIQWTFASVDWGYEHAGVMQVWGVDDQDRLYCLAEVYQSRRTFDWWADRALEFHKEFDLAAIICDPSRPESIEAFNQRIGRSRGKGIGHIARGADTTRKGKAGELAGTDLVRWYLSPGVDGRPRIGWCKDRLRYGRDQVLADKHLPTDTTRELPALTWEDHEAGKPRRGERWDPACVDDGCDALVYACNFAWGKSLAKKHHGHQFPLGSLGDVLGHDRIWRELGGPPEHLRTGSGTGQYFPSLHK